MKPGSSERVDFILINLMPEAGTNPSYEKALQHRRLNSTAGENNNHINIKDAFTLNSSIFKTYGSGVYLYFHLIEILIYTFVLISFNSLPVFLSNFKGNGLNMYGQASITKFIMKFSLGNQRNLLYQEMGSLSLSQFDVKITQALIVINDILNSFIFFAFLIFWKIRSDRVVQELITDDALPSYYTAQVRNLPIDYNEDSIKCHFQKFGAKVAQVSTVYNFDNVLSHVKTLIQLIDSYACAEKQKKQKIYQQIRQQTQTMRSITKFKFPVPVMCFVTFQDIVMRKKIKDLYKYKICPRELKYQNKLLKVQKCHVQPSSIIWENYHLQIKTQVRQSIIISLILIFVLLLALLALFLSNARATAMMQKQLASYVNFNYSKQYTFQQAKAQNSTQAIFVYCSKPDYHNVSLDFYHFCDPYFSAFKQKFGIMIGLSLLVVTINIILNWIICELAHFRRYKTKTQKSRFLILNTFALYFVNSGLLMLLIRVSFGGYSLGRIITSVISLPQNYFSLQSYSDFTKKWYISIGSQIVMIYAISLLTSPFIQIIINWMQAKFRKFKARRAKTQYRMNEVLLDSEFDFQTFYAMLLNACFFTMFHGNGMPILYILAIFAFICLYIASFIVFRYFSCKPTLFDHSLNQTISRVMCFALIAHQITSMLYIYTDDIFPTHGTQGQNVNQTAALANKIKSGIVYIFCLLFFIICTFNYNRICKNVKKYICIFFIPELQSSQMKNPKLFSEVFQQNSNTQKCESDEKLIQNNSKIRYLASYKMEDNPNYANVCYALKILSIFQPYFSTKSISFANRRSSFKQITEIPKDIEHIESQYQKNLFDYNVVTDRILIKQQIQ